MTRISLIEQYDNRSVIEQIRALYNRVVGAENSINGAVTNADAALSKANALEPIVTDNTASIADLDPRVLSNTNSIDSLESRVGTPNDTPAPAGTLFARVKTNTADIANTTSRVGDLETITADAITSAEFTANASTVTSVHKHLDQAVDTDAIPVASITQAGVINASDYASIVQMRQDVNELKGTVITYQITLPSAEPTQPQITLAFTTAYPTVSLVAGIKVADYNYNLAYLYDGSLWVEQQFTGTVPISTSTVVGGVLSSNVNGEVAVNVNGTMSLNGYDAIVGRLDDIDGVGGDIEQLESEIGSLDGRLDTAETNITTAQGDIGDIQTDIGEIDQDIIAIESDITTIQTAVAGKQDTLTAGDNITIQNNVISATGVEMLVLPRGLLLNYTIPTGSWSRFDGCYWTSEGRIEVAHDMLILHNVPDQSATYSDSYYWVPIANISTDVTQFNSCVFPKSWTGVLTFILRAYNTGTDRQAVGYSSTSKVTVTMTLENGVPTSVSYRDGFYVESKSGTASFFATYDSFTPTEPEPEP